ncbi:MAG TPA: IPT/TIG domain-containing protein [Bryobacteraceae bacterium]|nr:IPT/TIG domain-containing protein [Bryobacteraceae bacterium]
MRVLALCSLLLVQVVSATAQAPMVEPGGVVDAASFKGPVAPGSLVSIFGSNLASGNASAGVIPLPFTLGGVSVSFNGIAAPLLYVSPRQINAQLPWEISATGAVSVVVSNGTAASPPQDVEVAAFSPGLFTIGGYAVAVNPDGSLAAPAGAVPGIASHPAVPGDSLVLWGSGFGAVNPPATTGDNSMDALRNLASPPTVMIAGVAAPVTFAGLSPQFVGVYQINVTMPSTQPAANAASIEIEIGGVTGAVQTTIAVGTGWPQWAQNAQHTGNPSVAGQSLSEILANIVYDPLVPEEQSANYDELVAHYQVPLVDGNDVYMEYKSGSYQAGTFATEIWGENKFTWQGGQLVQQWETASDWKAPGSSNDFWEPVFHAALGNGVVYLPGASGSVIELNKASGALVQRFAPFGTDPNTYETGPITVDSGGNLYYNAIQVVTTNGFYGNDATNSWLVKISSAGAVTMATYQSLTSSQAPNSTSQCVTSFDTSQLPWPPSTTAVPETSTCGSQRAALNVSPAVAPDGTIYTVSRAHFNDRSSFLVALNPDLSLKWIASLRNRFHDGCGVSVADGGWLPPNGAPGGCAAGALQGVDPLTNQPGDGSVLDDASATPVVAPDGTILFGTWNRYNYAQGHLMHFDAGGNYLGAFGFGWDTTPAIYPHGDTWSLVTKNNHYGGLGSYCDDATFCPTDRTTNNPASPEQYFVTQLDANLNIEWSFQNTNTDSCTRNPDGTLTCVSDHPAGFEWCVNSPAIDANGVVYANSEDGNLFAIQQGGSAIQEIFQQLALGAAYTPASIGGDGKIYSQNDGHLFVVGN